MLDNEQLLSIINEQSLRIDSLEEQVKKLKPQKSTFTPPTYEEVCEYFKSKHGMRSEVVAFWNHYEANGWKVGKNKMKKWHNAAAKFISYKEPRKDLTKYERDAAPEITPKERERRNVLLKKWKTDLFTKEGHGWAGNTN
jgi:hypothetical protein